MSTKKYFSLTDLFCVAAVAVLLSAGILPAVEESNEMERRLECASNLKVIGSAVAIYSNSAARIIRAFPRAHYALDHADHPQFFTHWNQPNSFGPGAPESNDITAAFYLLLKTQDLDPRSLVCPDSNRKTLAFGDQTPKGADPIAALRTAISNFPSMDYVSYSIQNMYPSQDAINAGWKWNSAISPDFAIVADLNPGGKAVATVTPSSPPEEMSQANSRNHGGAGQNVLYGDFHVEWRLTPFAGRTLPDNNVDNIYCRRSGAPGDRVVGPSVDAKDSILLPAADYNPKPAQN
jgi:hypothetical protein